MYDTIKCWGDWAENAVTIPTLNRHEYPAVTEDAILTIDDAGPSRKPTLEIDPWDLLASCTTVEEKIQLARFISQED